MNSDQSGMGCMAMSGSCRLVATLPGAVSCQCDSLQVGQVGGQVGR